MSKLVELDGVWMHPKRAQEIRAKEANIRLYSERAAAGLGIFDGLAHSDNMELDLEETEFTAH